MIFTALIGGGALTFLALQARSNPCVKIMREFSVDYQGRVFPCCNIFPDLPENEKFVFGKVGIAKKLSADSESGAENADKGAQSIFEIFSSQTWAKWRKELFIKATKTPCTSCKDGYFDTDLDDTNARLRLLEKLGLKETLNLKNKERLC